MTDEVMHKCGIALIRLLKPLEYYQLTYGTWRYGLEKLYLLMEKQRNRGQDGAGVVSLKLNTSPGRKYFNRERETGSSAINEIFKTIYGKFSEAEQKRYAAAGFEDPKRCPECRRKKRKPPNSPARRERNGRYSGRRGRGEIEE